MINDGFGMSLIYGFVLVLLMGGVVLLGRQSEQTRWLRPIYDYSGVVMVVAPIILLALHIYWMREDRHGRIVNPTEVPMVREGGSLGGPLPASVSTGVLRTDGRGNGTAVEAGGVPVAGDRPLAP